MLQANDGPVDGLILPKEISCCSEEEALTIQHKLDVVISELRQIKDILCRHKVPRQSSLVDLMCLLRCLPTVLVPCAPHHGGRVCFRGRSFGTYDIHFLYTGKHNISGMY